MESPQRNISVCVIMKFHVGNIMSKKFPKTVFTFYHLLGWPCFNYCSMVNLRECGLKELSQELENCTTGHRVS